MPTRDLTRGVARPGWCWPGSRRCWSPARSLVADRLGAPGGRGRPAPRPGGQPPGRRGPRASGWSPRARRSCAEAGAAFNTMADRVVQLLAAERELVADLSHRLRTPLTALRLDAELVCAARGRPEPQVAVDAGSSTRWTRSSPRPGAGRRRAGAASTATWPRCCASGWRSGRRWPRTRAAAGSWSARPRRSGSRSRPASSAAAVDALLGNVFRHTPRGHGVRGDACMQGAGTVGMLVADAGPGSPTPRRRCGAGPAAPDPPDSAWTSPVSSPSPPAAR